MPRPKFTVAVVAALAATTASAAVAQAATAPRFVGTPSARYSGSTVGVVVRLDHALADSSSAGLFAAPSLKVGDKIGKSFGGNPPGRIGVASRHCYAAEAIRPEPLAKLQANAHWRLGLSISDKRIARTHAITLRRDTGTAASSDWEREAAQRLGCYSPRPTPRTTDEHRASESATLKSAEPQPAGWQRRQARSD